MPPMRLGRVIRSGLEESVHTGDVAVVDADGVLLAGAGHPDRLVFARSSMKPLQAAVSLSRAPFDFTDPEIAVMCASHNAEPVHIEAVRSLLDRAHVDEEALRCPAMRPWDDESLAADPARRRINSDCSGKHGGMLAACRAQGWPLETYRDTDHPLQQEILRAVLLACGEESVHVGVDGCGVPVHGMPLRAMATIYARLARPERLGKLESDARRAVGAMRAEPYMVAGRNRADTAVMQEASQVIAKGGAEGLMCATVLDRGLGLAVKVRDGASRATGPALILVLRSLGALDDESLTRLAAFARPPVLGGGEPVGEIRAGFELI
ncbi:MAG TPA: asparaginase [Actinomycetota bacterium]|nr:asparaginase [Actinomycetota bacterium]